MIEAIKRIHPLKLYLITILSFSIVYWGYWNYNNDAFIQNKDLNLNPSQTLNEIINETPDIESTGVIITPMSDLQLDVNSLQVRFIKNKLIDEKLKNDLTEIESKYKIAAKQLSKSWAFNTEGYVSKNTDRISKEIKNKKEQLELETSNHTSSNSSPSLYITNKLKIEISTLELERSKIILSSRNYVFAHPEEFHDQRMKSLVDDIYNLETETRNNLIKNSNEMVEIRKKAFELKEKKSSSLSIYDFIFYSVGIATTTTFGDIVANSTLIRSITCAQLLICILILSLTIGRLTKGK